MKLLVNFLIMIALLARGYSAGADGVEVLAHTHVEPTPTRVAFLAVPTALYDAASHALSEHEHDHRHPPMHSQTATIQPHEQRSHPIARHAHSRPANNHQHDEREAGVVYVSADDSANDASEALANVRALDGFVFLGEESAIRAPAPGRALLPAARGSHFKSRIPDPAERPPDR